jgi:hypothetical protein
MVCPLCKYKDFVSLTKVTAEHEFKMKFWAQINSEFHVEFMFVLQF